MRRSATAGTIAGFNRIVVGPDNTIDAGAPPSVQYTIPELMEIISRLIADLDPKRLYDLTMKVQQHLQDFDNPHHVTLEDLTSDVIKDVLTPYMQGTPPSSDPIFSISAEDAEICETTIACASPTYVVNRFGNIVQVPPNTHAIDYSCGFPLLSVWEQRTNLFTNSQMHYNGVILPLNAVEDSTSLVQGIGIGGAVYSVKDDGSNNEHGITLTTPTPTNFSVLYTTSLFLYAYKATGIIRITKGSHTAYLDLATRHLGDTTGRFEVCFLPNGWFRIGYQHSYLSSADRNIKITYALTDDVNEYLGDDSLIFTVYGLQHEEGKGMSPYIPTVGSVVTRQEAKLTIDTSLNVFNLMNGTVGFRCKAHTPFTPRNIISVGSDYFVRMTSNLISVKLSDANNIATVSLTNTDILQEFSFTYNNHHLLMISNDVTSEQNIPTPPVATGLVTIGPFAGSLYSFQTYGIHEGLEVLKYLSQ